MTVPETTKQVMVDHSGRNPDPTCVYCRQKIVWYEPRVEDAKGRFWHYRCARLRLGYLPEQE